MSIPLDLRRAVFLNVIFVISIIDRKMTNKYRSEIVHSGQLFNLKELGISTYINTKMSVYLFVSAFLGHFETDWDIPFGTKFLLDPE